MTPEPTDLLGTWTLSRTVDDRWSRVPRSVLGTATLTLAGTDRVRWSEEGTMTWAGGEVPVFRTLEVVRRDGAWFVLFGDGREFHPWSVGTPVDHPCGRDHYRGLVEAEGDPVATWTVTWHTRGPEKDYVMVTRHTERR